MTRGFVAHATVANTDAAFVIDTGSPGVVVTEPLLRRVTSEGGSVEDAEIASATLVDVHWIARPPLAHVRFGPVKFLSLQFDSAEAFVLPQRSMPGTDGLMGRNVLRQAAWIFDPAKETVTCCRMGALDDVLLRARYRVEGELPLIERASGLFVRAEVDGRDTEMMLDTGSTTSNVTRRLCRELRLASGIRLEQARQERLQQTLTKQLKGLGLQRVDVTSRPHENAGEVGLHGVLHKVDPYRVGTLAVGTVMLEDVLVFAATAPSGHECNRLGSDVLARFAWALDIEGGRLLVLASPR